MPYLMYSNLMDKRKILVGEKELGSSTNPRDEAYKDKMVGKIIIVKKAGKTLFPFIDCYL